MNNLETTKQRGRPRAFDKDEALRKALLIFWQRGYEGTSMADLSDALGINKPSIYAAFGNKEALFRQALQKYLAGPVAYIADAMNAPTALEAVERILKDSAELLTSKDSPRGCLIVQGALACGHESDLIRQELISYRKKFEESLAQRFIKSQLDSDLPRHINPAELAKYIATLHQGMSVQAASGASKEELLAMINLALTAWPGRRGQE
jgi:AcrR family transcriptional regulator